MSSAGTRSGMLAWMPGGWMWAMYSRRKCMYVCSRRERERQRGGWRAARLASDEAGRLAGWQAGRRYCAVLGAGAMQSMQANAAMAGYAEETRGRHACEVEIS